MELYWLLRIALGGLIRRNTDLALMRPTKEHVESNTFPATENIAMDRFRQLLDSRLA